VYDRTANAASHDALVAYTQAMNNLWHSGYYALPYLYYVDDRANVGGCLTGAGHAPGNSFILVCNGDPDGNPATVGKAYWAWNTTSNHYIGESNVWLQRGTSGTFNGEDFGWQYTNVCHEIAHVLTFDNHATETASCLNAVIDAPNKGHTVNDINELLNLYYSHYPA
jgi:hypothetical protein